MALFIRFSDFESLLAKWSWERPVYVPRGISNAIHYQKFASESQDSIVYDGIRAVEPLKTFFFRAKEKVAQRPAVASAERGKASSSFVIVGAKSCDLRSVECLDETFMKGDPQDPFYVERRNGATIISADCSAPAETCFCTMLGLKPYPEGGFDLNLSKISQGLVVEVGSEKGESLVSQDRALFAEASPEQIAERDKVREDTLAKVKGQNEKFNLSKSFRDITEEKLNSPAWNKYIGECKECAACLSVCPTCHCFLLLDRKVDDGFERFRLWDFCYHHGYARTAGGANARPTQQARFKNKYVKKFEFYMAKYGVYACTGCGRCIEACLANIDMRQVFKDLEGS